MSGSAAPPAVPAPDSQQKASGSEVTAEDVLSNSGSYEEIGRKLKGNKGSKFHGAHLRLILIIRCSVANGVIMTSLY